MFASKDELFTRPSGGYTIARSVRLRNNATASLTRTPASAGSSQKMTFSFWLKPSLSAMKTVFGCALSGSSIDAIGFENGYGYGTERFHVVSSGAGYNLLTTRRFRDPASWYHFVVAIDTTQATNTNRVKIYVNGVQETQFDVGTYPAQNANVPNWNSTSQNWIGNLGPNYSSYYFDGYLTEVNFIDGQQLTPSSFGSTNSITGVWQPAKYTGTYGTNGFYLPFSDNSSSTPTGIGRDFSGNTGTTVTGTTTSGSNSMTVVSLTGIAVGNSVSGAGIPAGTYVTAASVLTVTLSQNATSTNTSVSYTFSGNNWTPNNISVTAGVTYDSMTDVPTLTSATAANYAVMNPNNISSSSVSVTSGNLDLSIAASATCAVSTMAVTSGKWYWEFTAGSASSNSYYVSVCDVNNWSAPGKSQNDMYNSPYVWTYYGTTGQKITAATVASYGATFTNGDVIGVALDMDAGTLVFYKNNTSQGTAYSVFAGKTIAPMIGNGSSTNSIAGSINFGQRPFTYTPPTGYVALNTYNLPTSTITNGAAYMAASLFTATSGANNIVNSVNGIGFQPDFVWTKSRSNAQSNYLVDSVRGGTSLLRSESTNAESIYSSPPWVTSFNSNGYSTDTASLITTGYTYVGWQWKAGTTSSSNTNGSITSTVSAGATQGFSVVTYTGTGSNATVGHGLGVTPSMIIVKVRNLAGEYWPVRHTSIAATNGVYLNATDASGATTDWNNTAPTSTVFSIGTNNRIGGSYNYVAYCFAPVAGYSAFGSYTGNGSTDGPFVYCGFRPRFLMVKRTDTTGDWVIVDTSRNPSNLTTQELYPDLSNAEGSSTNFDLLSNGFKLRGFAGYVGASGGTYIYMAFAENPYKNALAR
jgi:hypothetical protein